MKTTSSVAFLSLALSCASTAQAVTIDTFGTDPNTSFEIEFVTIGNPGNAADTTGNPVPPHLTGSVAETYRIGKYEISEDMIDKANAETAATANPLNITHDGRGANKPATNISWFEAAKFVNWLNTSTGSTPAYKFDNGGNFQLWQSGDAGYDPNNLYRNSQATYFLPSVDEWYKAAYFDPNSGDFFNFATGSNTAPTPVASGTTADTAVYNQNLAAGPADITLAGGLSPYGTMGQGGNVWEWEETDFDLVNGPISSDLGLRGGRWDSNSNGVSVLVRFNAPPSFDSFDLGFRVASIPEPSTLLLGALAAVGILIGRRR